MNPVTGDKVFAATNSKRGDAKPFNVNETHAVTRKYKARVGGWQPCLGHLV